jgi:hypothetical protein
VSRSNYGDDYEYCDLWRTSVRNAIMGKRGQAFLRDLLTALDLMAEKRLIADRLESAGEVCAIGSLGRARGFDMSGIDPEDATSVAGLFNIAEALAREVVYENDEGNPLRAETPEQRWTRMRRWVAEQIKEPQP